MNTSPADLPFERLPDIDYARHPLYGRRVEGIGPGDRLLALMRYGQIVAYVLGVRLHHWWQRRPWVETGATPHLEALKRDGIVPLRLSAGARADILAASQGYFDRLEAHRKGIERGRRRYPDGQIDTTRDEALLMLPRRLRKKSKFGDDIPADSDWGSWLLENEQFVTSSQGDMLLFDVMGIHRGGMIERGERRILQIMMR